MPQNYALYALYYATNWVFEVTRYAMQECIRGKLYHYKDQYSSVSSDSHVKDIEIMPRCCGKMLRLLFVHELLSQDLRKAYFL